MHRCMKRQNNLLPIRKLCSDHHRCWNNNILPAGHCFKAAQYEVSMFGFEVVLKIHAHYGVVMCWSWRISVNSMRPLHPIYGHGQMASHKMFPRSLTIYFDSSLTTTNQTLLGAVCWKLNTRRKWWCGHATMFDEWSIYAKLRLESTFRIVNPRFWLPLW